MNARFYETKDVKLNWNLVILIDENTIFNDNQE